MVLKFFNDVIIFFDGIICMSIGLKYDCIYSCVFIRRVKVFYDFGDVVYIEEFMSIEELVVMVVREVRSEKIIRSIFFMLVFVSCVCLVCGVVVVGGVV